MAIPTAAPQTRAAEAHAARQEYAAAAAAGAAKTTATDAVDIFGHAPTSRDQHKCGSLPEPSAPTQPPTVKGNTRRSTVDGDTLTPHYAATRGCAPPEVVLKADALIKFSPSGADESRVWEIAVQAVMERPLPNMAGDNEAPVLLYFHTNIRTTTINCPPDGGVPWQEYQQLVREWWQRQLKKQV